MRSQTPIALLIFSILVLTEHRSIYAHAGHSHGPEVEVATQTDMAPRFYAVSEQLEGTVIFSADQSPGASLYLLDQNTNQPITSASLTIEYLTGGKGRVSVVATDQPGAYRLPNLSIPTTTSTLTVEVSSDSVFEILSLEFTPVSPVTVANAAPATLPAHSGSLPRYVFVALLAMNLVLVLTALAAFVLWRRDQRTAVAVLAITGLMTLGYPSDVHAHAGEDHTGDSLLGHSQTGPSMVHFVPVFAQVEGGILTSNTIASTLPRSIRALGQVEIRPDHRAIVTPPSEGRLLAATSGTEVLPIQGQSVQAGQVLAILEQVLPVNERVAFLAEKAQSEGELGEAQQELALALRVRERAERLSKVIPEEEVDQARTGEKVARFRVEGLRRRVETLDGALSSSGTLRQIPIRSPISGMIHESHATRGEYVRPEKTLFDIVSLDQVFVGADIFETELRAVEDGKTARITVEAWPGKEFNGILHSISQEINRDTRSAHVLFAVPNPEKHLRGGMFATFQIESDTNRQVLTIPRQAVISENGLRLVYRKVAPELFAATPVRVLEYRGNLAIVASGLKEGDRVAVTGIYQVRRAPIVDTTPTAGSR